MKYAIHFVINPNNREHTTCKAYEEGKAVPVTGHGGP
jgi:hypothetical protein